MKILICKIFIICIIFSINNVFSSPSVQNVLFSELVVKCQNLIRQFASEQLKYHGMEENEAELRAKSCVSQRDIQVLVIMYVATIMYYPCFLHREYLHFMVGFPRHTKCFKCE